MITEKLKQIGDVIGLDKFLYIIIYYLFISCSNDTKSLAITRDAFITSPGIYFFKGNTLKLSNIDNGCYVFSLKKTKDDLTYINADINKCFNKNMFWSLYIDNDKNIWFFNSDYRTNAVWFSKENYKKHDFIRENIKLPVKFKEKIENH